MEIQTQNLLSVVFDGNKLTNNFVVIDEMLKRMQNQFTQLSKKQQAFEKCLDHQNTSFGKLDRKVKEQGKTIRTHGQVLEQLGMELEPEQISEKNEEKIESVQSIMSAQGKRTSELSISASNTKKQRNINSPKETSKDINTKTSKFGVDKMMSNLKQRLANLERDSQEKQVFLNQLQNYLEKGRNKDSSLHFKKKPVEGLRRSSKSRKNLNQDKSRPSLCVPTTELQKQFSSSSIPQSNADLKDSEWGFPSQFSGEEVSREFIYLRNSLMQKIKAIQAQFKENQHKTQAIEKTVDILERSHEMLKYDFDRTSTSWSKNRSLNTGNTQDKIKRDERFSEIVLNSPQEYQQKIGQICNQMEIIKKDYEQINTKLNCSKDEDTNISNHPLLLPEGKEKAKLVHTLKTEGSEQKKDINLIKRQLTKLRCQFEDFAFGVNTNPGETKTVVIKPNQNKEDWKILSTKIYKLKMEVTSGLRDMENKITANNDMVVVLNSLQTGIEECRLLMKRKVEFNDYEKGIKRIDTKLNNLISQIYGKESKQNDNQASMARQPWCCLSCGDQIKNYTAKISKSPTKQKLQGKKVNPQHHMVRRNQNGRFPSVLK